MGMNVSFLGDNNHRFGSRLIANPSLSPSGVGNQSEVLDDVACWRVEVKERGTRKDWMLGMGSDDITTFKAEPRRFPRRALKPTSDVPNTEETPLPSGIGKTPRLGWMGKKKKKYNIYHYKFFARQDSPKGSELPSKRNTMEHDFIRTPRSITEALMRYETFTGSILEPCCGDGAIAKVLLDKGYEVTASDKYDYGYGGQQDLFNLVDDYDNIITNPPFGQQQKVKKHLMVLVRKKLALLWYVKNLGNELETKTAKHLKTVYIFKEKIPWVEVKIGWLFAWYVWDKDYEGDITIRRIDY
jgi:hypothetical protein